MYATSLSGTCTVSEAADAEVPVQRCNHVKNRFKGQVFHESHTMTFTEWVQEANQLLQYIKYGMWFDSHHYQGKVHATRRQLRYIHDKIKSELPDFAGLEVMRFFSPPEVEAVDPIHSSFNHQ